MWNALYNFSNGRFHEPRFYGQNYNTLFEALFAVPFYRLGIPVYKALPLVTSILTLFPFFLFSFFNYKRKSFLTALGILSLPILLPPEYHLVTSLSRGFVTGIFISSLGIVSLFHPNKKWAWLLLGFTGILGYAFNPNSILVFIPLSVYFTSKQLKNKYYYINLLVGVLLGAIYPICSFLFYSFHPNYILHKTEVSFRFNYIQQTIKELDVFFDGVSPLLWYNGWIWLIALLIFSLVLLKKQRHEASISVIATLGLILFTFGVGKIHDYSDSIFFPASRMYLAFPILIVIFLSILPKYRLNGISLVILALPGVYFVSHIKKMETYISSQTQMDGNHIVSIRPVKEIISECEKLNELCIKEKVDLIVINNHPSYNFINFGCSACVDEFPNTLRPAYERRTWRLIKDEQKVYENVLFLDSKINLSLSGLHFDTISDQEHSFILKGNQFKTMELLNMVGIPVRPY